MTDATSTRLMTWSELALLPCAALLLFPALGGTPLTRAEIYFADAARAMVERGDWLVPYFRGAPFFDKPALTYWVLAVSFDWFGSTVAAARAGLAVAALLAIASTVWLGWLLWKDRHSAVLGGWILVGTAAFMSFGRIAMSDMLLTLWTTLGIALAVACYQSRRPSIPLLALAVVLGLGFLTKGPIALLVTGLGCASLIWSRRAFPLGVSAPMWFLACGVLIAIALSWFLAVYVRLGREPLEYFFVRENLQRFAADTYDARRPAWFYLTAYLGEGAPWSLLLPLAAWQLGRIERDAAARLLLIWMMLVVVLLSASRGKIDYYLLPLYPAAALVVGRYLSRAVWARPGRIWARVVLVLLGLVSVLVPMLVVRIPVGWRPSGLALAGVVAGLVVPGVVCLRTVIRPRPGRVLMALVLVSCALFGLASVFILPAYYQAQPNRAILEDILRERRERPDAAVALRADPTQMERDLLFHARIVTEPVRSTADLQRWALSSRPSLLLAAPDEADALQQVADIRRVGEYQYLPSRVTTLRGVVSETKPERLVLLATFDK